MGHIGEVMSLRAKPLCLSAVIILMLIVCSIELRAQTPSNTSSPQKEIAITIDDLPLNGPRIPLERLRAMTDKLLSGIKRHQIPVVGFVNESLLYVPGEVEARIALLKEWIDAGVELGNHTFSHLGFRNASLADYEDDFIRGESITQMLMKQKGQKLRYFRHPFLQMGTTPGLEKSFESFIAERGYRIAPVTIDTMDWMILAAYSKARDAGDAEMMKRVADEYLKFAGQKFDFNEKVTDELFGHPIKHILLLHVNELNADNFDALVKVMTDRGYQFITLEEALKDPVYQYPEKYLATSDWLGLWSFNKGKKFNSPMPPEFIQKIYNDGQK
jgi:peptidoglycan/xylan/chitin deacetylase (PgdA/CDA1 family)